MSFRNPTPYVGNARSGALAGGALARDSRPRRRGTGIVPVVQLPLSLAILVWIARGIPYVFYGLARLVITAIRHPRATLTLITFSAAWITLGPKVLAIILVGATLAAAATLLTWRRLRPASYRQHVARRFRDEWRQRWVYRRHWQPAMVTTGLATVTSRGEYLPTLKRVKTGSGSDDILVTMLAGQRIGDYAEVADDLARFFGAGQATVRRGEHLGQVWLRFSQNPADAQPPVKHDDHRAQVRTLTRASWSRPTSAPSTPAA